jgi:hypothetical protein
MKLNRFEGINSTRTGLTLANLGVLAPRTKIDLCRHLMLGVCGRNQMHIQGRWANSTVVHRRYTWPRHARCKKGLFSSRFYCMVLFICKNKWLLSLNAPSDPSLIWMPIPAD